MDQITSCCTRCGRPIVFGAGASVQCCVACGCLNERPRAQGPTLDLLRRATEQRLRCDFANAENSYQHVLLDYPDEHEALWGLALCRYGVEYVDDPQTGKRLPVVHGVRKKPLQTDSDFEQACEAASADVRAQYEAEAEYIDNAMHRIRELAETCPPFDVFICHKTTKPGSDEYTEDYNRAFKLYHMLDKLGYRAFFAPMEMEGVAAGSDYEAGICHALETAKVMLVVCSDAEYLKSPWVRNEWRRFLEMADGGADKCLLPLMYGEFQPAQLPRDFRVRKLQTVIMGEMGSAEKVVGTVRKYAGLPQPAPVEPVAPVAPALEPPAPVAPVPVAPAPEPPAPVAPAPVQPAPVAPVPVAPAPVQPAPVAPAPVAPAPEQHAPVQPDPELTVQRAALIRTLKAIQLDRQRTLLQALTAMQQQKQQAVPAAPAPEPAVKYADASDFRTTPCSNGCIITGYSGKAAELVIPPMIDGRPVVRIGIEAFRNNRELVSVVLPETVSVILLGAFRECAKLRKITLPEKLTMIQNNAFQSCRSLESITLPQGITAIESYTFNGCHSLEKIVLPPHVTMIGESAFEHCITLKTVQLPRELREIRNMAFYRCFELKRINVSGAVQLGKDVFGQCRNLPESLRRRSRGSLAGLIDKILPF